MHSGSALHRARVLIFALLALTLASPVAGQEASKPENQLAERLLSRLGNPTSASLVLKNLSSTPAGEADRIRHELERQFLLHGVRVVPPDQAAVNVVVTLSENARETLWIAEIVEGQTREIMILPTGRSTNAPAQKLEDTFSLQSRLVLNQDSPILDFAEMPAISGVDHQLLVLSPGAILLYGMQQNTPQLLQQVKLDTASLKTRDPRGRLLLHDNTFEAYLPGYHCTGNTGGTILASCQQSDDPWPLLPQLSSVRAFYANTRNFFTGVVTGAGQDQSLPAFFSAAVLSDGDHDHFVLAGTDGHLQSGNGTRYSVSFGTEIASVKPDCSTSSLILVSRGGDWTAGDAVRLLTETGLDLKTVSHEVELPGPVLSMWSGSASQVNLVVRNLQTGAYEAYIFSVACTR